MPDYTHILRNLTFDKFQQVVNASDRKIREIYFHRHMIRVKPVKGLQKIGYKNLQRLKELFQIFQQQNDDELAEEILRTWLLTQRPLLATALEHLKIPHEQGLSNSDEVNRIADLKSEKLLNLWHALKDFPAEDVLTYLRFMGVDATELQNIQ